ncbi:MAG: hypothetical protein P1Q69_16195 [Candidatus Thorarchaeota archaeon]|nr:hypothetical protein [Candidatus Thorarchaeota archaeon]
MVGTIYIDDDLEPTQQAPADWQQGFWFDDGLYKEWLTFLYGIWNTVEYL